MNVNVPMLDAGLGLVLVSLVALLVVVRRRRRPAEPAADLVEETTAAEPAHEDGPRVGSPVPDASGDVRALRAQVRVLEELLERVTEPAVEQPDLASYRVQVRAAVEAVARRTQIDADPRLVAARVTAAVARLDADPADRVVLPVPLRRPVVVAPVVPEPVPSTNPEDGLEDDADQWPAVDDELVLPVPPPAPAEPRRSKRRMRRPAA